MRIFPYLLILFLLTACAQGSPSEVLTETSPAVIVMAEDSAAVTEELPDPIREIMNEMSLEERVGQLFLARCAEETALADIETYHLGGFVLFGVDFEDENPASIREKLRAYQEAAKRPLLIAVDEEGGTVNRISSFPAFRSSPFPSPRTAFIQGGILQVLSNEEEKYQLLASLGINVNIGPVCDITTDPSSFMYQRSLGQDAATTAGFASGAVTLMNAYSIGSVLKHFPGYGNNTDTHTGIAVDSRSLNELEANDLLPFAAGMEAGCGAIMVSHTIVEALDSQLPATLSPAVHQYLREEMGFKGVIITDDLAMQAITDQYGSEESSVLAVLAGNDLLCATDYAAQYSAVLAAVLDGRISIDILNSAVKNVLEWKMDLGLI